MLKRLLLLLSVLGFAFQSLSDERESLLDSLDREVALSEVYIRQKESVIESMKKNLRAASFDNDRYLCSKQIFNEYLKFNPDSAKVYSDLCHRIGEAAHRPDWQQEAQMGQALLLVLRSVHPAADEALYRLGPVDSIFPQLRPLYAKLVFLYNSHVMNDNSAENIQNRKALWDSLKEYVSVDDPMYLSYRGTMNPQDTTVFDEKNILHYLNKSKPFSEDRAMMELIYYNYLRRMGHETEAFSHLVYSAICDIRSANREAQSLLSITRQLNTERLTNKQLNRVFNYAMLCEDNARIYKDMGRSLQLIEAQKLLQRTYKDKIESRQRDLFIALSLVSLLLIIVVIMFFILRNKKRKQDESYAQIKEINAQLNAEVTRGKRMSEEISQTNEKLAKEIRERDKYLVTAFHLGSSYIKSTKEYKKNISNLLTTGMVKEARKVAGSAVLSDASIAQLQTQFDKAFVTIHPDFLERFNRLLKPEARIYLESPLTLTPDLRIYAIISLGITDSVSIADFLHFSSQTVYNYRLRMRRNAAIPEKTFDETVSKLFDNPN